MPQTPENLFRRGRYWYAKIQHAGEVHRISLKTSDKKLALKKAAALRREIESGNLAVLDTLRGRAVCSTVDDLLTAHAAYWAAKRRVPQTATDYSAALLRTLANAHPGKPEESLRKLPLSTLTAALLERYEEAKLASAADHLEIQRRLGGLGSDATQAGALVSPRFLKTHHAAKLRLPDLSGFREVQLEEPEARGYRAPSAATVQRTIKEAAQLRQNDLPRWYAFMLAVGIGLRRSEAVAARWDWLAIVPVRIPQLDGTVKDAADFQCRVDISIDFCTKRSQRQVSVDPSVWEALHAERDKTVSHIIPFAHKTARDQCFRENARWLRGLGWDPDRPNHDLRKYFADQLRQLHGLEAAQRALGHKNQRTTESIYTGQGGVGKTVSFPTALGKAVAL